MTFRLINFTPDLPSPKVRAAIGKALGLWTNATSLRFAEVFNGPADLRLFFASKDHEDGYAFDGPGNVLAHAFLPNTAKQGEIHFDDDETWSYENRSGTDLLGVATHEIGHALGLQHSTQFESVMYPVYRGYSPDLRLGGDDIANVERLYGGSTPAVLKRTPPNVCAVSLDAAAFIRGEFFFFKDEWFWRKRINENVSDSYPARIRRFWLALPGDLSGVDAVYQRGTNGEIVFFKDRRYWTLNDNWNRRKCPPEGYDISRFGFPQSVKRIDAAFIHPTDIGKTYFLTGASYWCYDEYRRRFEIGYPRSIRLWWGLSGPFDAAFNTEKNVIVLIKDGRYVRVDDLFSTPPVAINVADVWLGCRPRALSGRASVLYTPLVWYTLTIVSFARQ